MNASVPFSVPFAVEDVTSELGFDAIVGGVVICKCVLVNVIVVLGCIVVAFVVFTELAELEEEIRVDVGLPKMLLVLVAPVVTFVVCSGIGEMEVNPCFVDSEFLVGMVLSISVLVLN